MLRLQDTAPPSFGPGPCSGRGPHALTARRPDDGMQRGGDEIGLQVSRWRCQAGLRPACQLARRATWGSTEGRSPFPAWGTWKAQGDVCADRDGVGHILTPLSGGGVGGSGGRVPHPWCSLRHCHGQAHHPGTPPRRPCRCCGQEEHLDGPGDGCRKDPLPSQVRAGRRGWLDPSGDILSWPMDTGDDAGRSRRSGRYISMLVLIRA
jgi:hypothetical protein